MDLLQRTRVGSVLPEERSTVITATSKDSMSSAFKTLIENKILSVPVWDLHKHKYTSFVDMVDLVSLSVDTFSEAELKSEADLSHLMESAVALRNKSVGEIADFSHRNPYMPVESRAPLMAAVQLMTKWAVHRVPVIDAEGSLITVLSQSQVVHWLSNHTSVFGEIGHKSLSELGLGQSGIISIHWDQRAIDAFQLIHKHGVSAVAVVDDAGVLVGNISVSDLKVIGYDATLVSRLFYSVKEFLKVISTSPTYAQAFQGPQFMETTATLSETIKKLACTRTHRVYVVDEARRPIGVVSNLEVLRSLCDAIGARNL